MRNQTSIAEGPVLSEVFYIVFLGLLHTAAYDSERCPDVHFGNKVKDKIKILSSTFSFASRRSFFCWQQVYIHFKFSVPHMQKKRQNSSQ